MAPGIFSAGADLKERKEIPPEEVGPFVARARRFFREFQEMPVPTICALDGAALGGGLEWAISHDLRVASGKILKFESSLRVMFKVDGLDGPMLTVRSKALK